MHAVVLRAHIMLLRERFSFDAMFEQSGLPTFACTKDKDVEIEFHRLVAVEQWMMIVRR